MNIKITILEDKIEEQERLITALNNWAQNRVVTLDILHYDSGESYLASHKTDDSHLYILDIELPGMDGIKFAEQLRIRGYQGIILFLSAFQEYVFQGYDVHALHYLLKPVVQEKLDKCLDDVQEQLANDYFVFRNGTEKLQLPYREIICFSARDHFVDITTTKEVYSIRQTLKNILPFLPHNFVQCHRSYIVNVRYVTNIGTDRIYLPNKKIALLGRNYVESFHHEFSLFTARLF